MARWTVADCWLNYALSRALCTLLRAAATTEKKVFELEIYHQQNGASCRVEIHRSTYNHCRAEWDGKNDTINWCHRSSFTRRRFSTVILEPMECKLMYFFVNFGDDSLFPRWHSEAESGISMQTHFWCEFNWNMFDDICSKWQTYFYCLAVDGAGRIIEY